MVNKRGPETPGSPMFSGRDFPSFRQEFHMNLELVLALFWFGSTDVRKLARQRKCRNLIGIY